MDLGSESLEAFMGRVRVYKKIRMLGSAALSLAYVAMGRFDIYEEESIRLWDVGAGLALVQAAGGAVQFEFTNRDEFVLNVKAGASALLLQGT